MREYFSILVFVLLPVIFVSAQEEIHPIISKAIYFDISPPLRSMQLKPSGKIDRTWKDGVVPNFFTTPGKVDRFGDRPMDTVLQLQPGHIIPGSIIQNFDGVNNVNNCVPPDTYGDVGPSHYFQLVNLSFAIFDKSGTKLLGPLNTSLIWEGLPHNYNNGDGVVLYDEQADRWLISQFSFPSFPDGPFYQMIAVSQTPDPTGSWYRWEYVFVDLPDYPKFGIWPDGYYMSYTRIKSNFLQRIGIGVVSFDRDAMIIGDPAPRAIQFTLPTLNNPVSLLPADCDGPFPPTGTPNYYANNASDYFVIREFHSDWNNPDESTFGNTLKLPISPYNVIIPGIPQKDSDKILVSLNDRLMYRLQFRKFKDHQSMVVNHTVDAGSCVGIRWYELRKTSGNWFVYQHSTYSPDDSLYRWMGSIAMDSSGNIALGYSISGSSIYPSIRFTGRMKHDPLGQMTILEKTIFDGTGSQTGIWSQQSRWGDYSSMTVDPSVPSTFWYTQEYYVTTSWNSWRTRIASFSFTGILDINATASPGVICAGDSSRLNVEVSGGSDTCTFTWTSYPAGFTSDQRNPLILPAMSTTCIVEVLSGSQVKTDSVLVSVIPPPSVFAGNDTAVCRYISELPLSGTASNNNSVRWFTSGDGTFLQPDALNTIYQLGINDRLSDTLFLKLMVYPVVPCLAVTSTRNVIIDTCAGITEISGNVLVVRLHPNPAHEKLTFEISGAKGHDINIFIVNVLDEVLYSELIQRVDHSLNKQINLSALSKGLYFLRIQTNSGIVVKPFLVR